MAKYRVVYPFVDTNDAHHVYRVGDPFPRAGAVVSEERVNYLASDKTRMKQPVIVAVADEVEPKVAEVIEVAEPSEVAEESVEQLSFTEEAEQPKPKKSRRSKNAN